MTVDHGLTYFNKKSIKVLRLTTVELAVTHYVYDWCTKLRKVLRCQTLLELTRYKHENSNEWNSLDETIAVGGVVNFELRIFPRINGGSLLSTLHATYSLKIKPRTIYKHKLAQCSLPAPYEGRGLILNPHNHSPNQLRYVKV